MFRSVLLLLLAVTVVYTDTQVTYTIGGSDVIFVFARSGNVTSITWTDFGATADGSGVLDSGAGSVPVGYEPGAVYIYPPEGIVHCVGIPSGLAYFQVRSLAPSIKIYPLNGNDTAWAPNQDVVFRAGSVVYTNF